MKFIDILCKRSVPQLKQSRSWWTNCCLCGSTLTHILSARAALVEYKSISRKTLQESIESEMSGELESLLLAIGESENTSNIRQAATKLENLSNWTDSRVLFNLCCLFPVKCVNSVPAYFAELLYKSMKVNIQLFSRLPRPFEAIVIILNTDMKGFQYLQQSISARVLLSGLRNRRVDSDQNHGDSVWARPAGHQDGVQEGLQVLAAQRHQGEGALIFLVMVENSELLLPQY